MPITFPILLIAFGAFVAAGVPVLLAFSGVLGSIGLSAILSHVFHASDSTSSVILLMGMAVGVDYSLFYLKREREERARGREPRAALARAAATSGQAVLISGSTVLIAMAGMLFAGSKIFTSIGIGAMIVVFLAMVGSLTVLPALLAKLGDRVDRGVLTVIAAGRGGRCGRSVGDRRCSTGSSAGARSCSGPRASAASRGSGASSCARRFVSRHSPGSVRRRSWSSSRCQRSACTRA